jgi:hypothetical protein
MVVVAATRPPTGYTFGIRRGSLESMSVTTIKLQGEVRDRLARVASDEFGGASMSETVERLLAEHEEAQLARQIAQAYARLREDPEAWASYTSELDEWDGTTADGLSEDETGVA